MSTSGSTPEEFATDTLALNYITQAASEVLGDRKAAEQVAFKAMADDRVMYAALCYIAESVEWETLVAAVRAALGAGETAQAPESASEQGETGPGAMCATVRQRVTYTVTKGKRIVEQGTATVAEYEHLRRVWTMSLGADRSRYTVTCQPA